MNETELTTGQTGSPGETLLLDPTSEVEPSGRSLVPRKASLVWVTFCMVDISIPRGDVFLDRLEEHLCQRGATVLRYIKPTFTKPAPVDLRHEIASQCDAVIEALAD